VLAITNAKGQITDSITFDNYVSPTNNDLVNYFSGNFTMTQITTNGISGGSVTPEVFADPYARFDSVFTFTTNPTTASICFKYDSTRDNRTGLVTALIGFKLLDSADNIIGEIEALTDYLTSIDPVFGIQTPTAANGNYNFPGGLATGHWYKIVFKAQQSIVPDSVLCSAYLYDIGTSGLSAPSLTTSFANKNFYLAGSHMSKIKAYPFFLGDTGSGVLYLDNFGVTGHTFVGVKETELYPDFFMPTLVGATLPVACNTDEHIDFAIFDANGSVKKRGSFINKSKIDVSDLAPSTYFIRFLSEQGIFTRKFIKPG
jgi:hypothetical protein